ncbi:MAG TPA: NnrU family protein [Burkholderiaceae bacterium]|nr:NnrU family protein [Burkholderiaceae bacterium]
MIVLVAGLLLFLGVHSIRIFADDWRSAQVARLGAMKWKGIYSVVSVIGFGLIIWGFGMARMAPVVLWAPPLWTRHMAGLLMLLAIILLVAAYVPGNHIKARIGHPMLAATKTWALAHLLANGTLADVVLFGAFLIWSIVAFATSRRRDRAAGVTYPSLGIGRGVLTIVIGIAAWALIAFYLHLKLIGVSPFA